LALFYPCKSNFSHIQQEFTAIFTQDVAFTKKTSLWTPKGLLELINLSRRK